jgi:argininosuccinate lyase
LTIEEYKCISEVFNESVYSAISIETCVNARNIAGGPAESATLAAIKDAEEFLKNTNIF